MEDSKHLDELVQQQAEKKAELAEVERRIREGAKEAAVVLVDLAGSTQLKQGRAGEHWLGYIYGFLQLASGLATKAGGTLVKRLGDGALVSFETTGAAEAFLDSLNSSVDAATYPHKAAAEFGSVYYFRFEPSLRDDPYGQAVDRCARILDKATAGVTLCGRGFRDASADKARFFSAGPFKLKGFAEPQELFFRPTGSRIRAEEYLRPLLGTLNDESCQRSGYRYVPRVFSEADFRWLTGTARPFLLRELLNVPKLPWSYEEFTEKVWATKDGEDMLDFCGMLVEWEGKFSSYHRNNDEISVWIHREGGSGGTSVRLLLPLFMSDVVRLFSKGDRMRFRGVICCANILAIELNYVDVEFPP